MATEVPMCLSFNEMIDSFISNLQIDQCNNMPRKAQRRNHTHHQQTLSLTYGRSPSPPPSTEDYRILSPSILLYYFHSFLDLLARSFTQLIVLDIFCIMPQQYKRYDAVENTTFFLKYFSKFALPN